MKLLGLLLLVPFTAAASEHYATSDGSQAAVHAYSRAAHLPPLKARDEDALRVWVRDFMSGQVDGYVITKTNAMSCHASSRFTDGSITIGSVGCRRIRRPASIDDAIRALPTFSRREWDCPAFDGGEVFIEGIRRHAYFAVRVGNPQACDDPESRAIVELLEKLW